MRGRSVRKDISISLYIFGNMFCFDPKFQREGEYILNEVNLFLNVFENVIGRFFIFRKKRFFFCFCFFLFKTENCLYWYLVNLGFPPYVHLPVLTMNDFFFIQNNKLFVLVFGKFGIPSLSSFVCFNGEQFFCLTMES